MGRNRAGHNGEDIILKVPFAGSMVMDILFILSAAIVGYLGWDAYKDMT